MSFTVGVVGLGYVGSVTAASLAARGIPVLGIDLREGVVAAIDRGVAPIDEPGLEERIRRAQTRGTLRVTTETDLSACRASLLCVGTPVGEDGQLVTDDIFAALDVVNATAPEGHVVVIRSTVPPGLYQRARAHLRADLALALNPEFLREGSAVRDLEDPELVVFATESDAAVEFLEELYEPVRERLHRTDPATAEVLKLVNNAWHALKVAFANEVARVTLPVGVDPFAVMRLLCADTKLNTSAAYLRPGMPFGGACLVKDVASIQTHAATHAVDAPLFGSILRSNDAHLQYLADVVLKHEPKTAAIIGVGFKPGAADVRDSAPVRLVAKLLDAGVHVTVADSAVLDSRVPPLGLAALQAALGDPRAQAAPDVEHAIAGADVIVVGHPSEADRRALVALQPSVPILDSAGELSRKLSDDERETLTPVVVLAAH
ncbi:MAG: nucleotide sugar dehydrogenase [Myxococcota bacterium]